MSNDYDAKRAAIEEREEQTGNAILWYTDCALHTYKQTYNDNYRQALQEYLDNGGSLPCWVVYDGTEHTIYDNEADAVEAAFDLL